MMKTSKNAIEFSTGTVGDDFVLYLFSCCSIDEASHIAKIARSIKFDSGNIEVSTECIRLPRFLKRGIGKVLQKPEEIRSVCKFNFWVIIQLSKLNTSDMNYCVNNLDKYLSTVLKELEKHYYIICCERIGNYFYEYFGIDIKNY